MLRQTGVWLLGLASLTLALYWPQVFLVCCLLIWLACNLVAWAESNSILTDSGAIANEEEEDCKGEEVVFSRTQPRRSISVPKDYKQSAKEQCPKAVPSKGHQRSLSGSLYKKNCSTQQTGRSFKKCAARLGDASTQARRQRFNTLQESLSWSDSSLDLDDTEQLLHRNSSIRSSCRSGCSWTGSCGDLSETAVGVSDTEMPEPDIKFFSSSCGDLHHKLERQLKDCINIVDSWDGLQTLGRGTFAKRPAGEDEKEGAGAGGSTINLHYHWGTYVHMENTSEVQIGNHNVMKPSPGSNSPAANKDDKTREHHQGAAHDDEHHEDKRNGMVRDDDLVIDGEDVYLSDSDLSDIEYEVVEDCDITAPHDSQLHAVLCERGTSYHDPTTLRLSGTGPVLERGTSYHDPTEGGVDHRDMATGTTMSLLRGACLDDYVEANMTSGDTVVKGMATEWRCAQGVGGHVTGDDHVTSEDIVFLPNQFSVGDEVGREGERFTYEEKKAKMISALQKHRRLKSEGLPKKPKKGLLKFIRRKKST